MRVWGRSRAFSLLELLVAMSLVLGLLALATTQLKPAAHPAQARGAAEILAAALRSARQRALATARPVAIALPSEDGSRSCAAGFYWLEGEVHPLRSRAVNLQGEFPQAVLAAGSYPGVAFSTQPGVGAPSFDLSQWSPPSPQDPTVVFLPSGQAWANLPSLDGHYCLFSATALEASGVPAVLVRARDVYCIRVSWSGEVKLDTGLAGASAGVLGGAVSTGAVALPQSSLRPPNHAPTLIAPFLTVEPLPKEESRSLIVPTTATATVPLGGTLTLTTYARDEDGDVLTCTWSGAGPAGPGSFSADASHRMRWDSTLNCWVARWSWRVPAGAAPEQHYALNCSIEDGRGGVTTPLDVNVRIPDVFTLPPGHLVYTSGNELWTANWDGTDPKRLVRRSQLPGGSLPDFPRWSVDGSRIGFITRNDGGIWSVNRDGTDLHRMRLTGNLLRGAQWALHGRLLYLLESRDVDSYLALRSIPASARESPDPAPVVSDMAAPGIFRFLTASRNQEVFLTSNGSQMAVIWPNHPSSNTLLPLNWKEPRFSADGSQLYFVRNDSELGRAAVTIDNGAHTLSFATPVIHNTGIPQLNSPVPSPDGRWLVAQSGGGPVRMVLMRPDGSGARTVPMPTNIANNMDWTWK